MSKITVQITGPATAKQVAQFYDELRFSLTTSVVPDIDIIAEAGFAPPPEPANGAK